MRLRDMERRCAGAVVATGLAGGEMEDSLEPLHPAHGRTTRRMGLAGGVTGTVGDDAAAVFEVRGEHAVVPGEMGTGAWYEGGEAGDAKSAGLPICTAGGCPEGVRHTDVPHEFHRVEHDMSRPVTEGVLESIHDMAAVIDRDAFVRDGRAGDVAAKAFEGVPLMGSAARADPRLHHSGGRWRENPES